MPTHKTTLSPLARKLSNRWAAVIGMLWSTSIVSAGTITVTTLSDNFTVPVSGSLRAAINQANADPSQSWNIVFNVAGGGTSTLAANAAGARMLPILTNPMGISIDGSNNGQGAITLSGGFTGPNTGDRIFFVGVADNTPSATSGNLAGTTNTAFNISNLTLVNGNARGGSSTNASTTGGGGAGLGGAIFVNAGNLTVSGVTFTANRATGGNAGTSTGAVGNHTGGGGLGGNGNFGGGGFGIGATGGNGNQTGTAGVFTGGQRGGNSGALPGGINGGGGAGGTSTTGSGGGGVGGLGANSSGGGGNGGFGGGGGGSATAVAGTAGFGGGGGSGILGGMGGFGGGGGGGLVSAGTGGFGGGNGALGSPGTSGAAGGGGAGLGGAIFVRQGATINIVDGSIAGNLAAGGFGANLGIGTGSGIFLGGQVNYTVSAGNTVTLNNNTLAGGIDPQISGGLSKDGGGTLVLGTANSYVGQTSVSAGTLLVNNTGTFSGTGSGNVDVTGGIFGGTGTTSGDVFVDLAGILAPGNNGIGAFNVGNLFITTTGTFQSEINVGATPSADLLNIHGALTLGTQSVLNLALSNLGNLQSPETFLVMNNDAGDAVTGHFGSITGVPSGYVAKVDYGFTGADSLGRVGDGNDVAVTIAATPIPTTVASGAVLLIAIGTMQVRQRRVCRKLSGSSV